MKDGSAACLQACKVWCSNRFHMRSTGGCEQRRRWRTWGPMRWLRCSRSRRRRRSAPPHTRFLRAEEIKFSPAPHKQMCIFAFCSMATQSERSQGGKQKVASGRKAAGDAQRARERSWGKSRSERASENGNGHHFPFIQQKSVARSHMHRRERQRKRRECAIAT